MSVSRLKTCFLYGEGSNDKKFLNALIGLQTFIHHTNGWDITPPDNASGESPRVVLEKCRNIISNKSYDLVVCLIDTDKLNTDGKGTLEMKRRELEEEFAPIKIIWSEENLEDEIVRVLPRVVGKKKATKLSKAIEKIENFQNTRIWNEILVYIRAID